MAELGSLVVRIEGDVTKLDRELKRGEQIVQRSASKMRKILSVVTLEFSIQQAIKNLNEILDRVQAKLQTFRDRAARAAKVGATLFALFKAPIITIGLAVLVRRLRAVGRGFRAAVARVKSFIRSIFNLRNTIVGAGLLLLVRSITKVGDSLRQMEGRLKLVTKNSSELIVVQKKLFDVANRTGQSFESTAKLYADLALRGRELKLTSEDLLGVTEGLNTTILLSGSSTQAASGGVLAFGQALGSAKVEVVEMTRIIKDIPRLGQAIADAFADELAGKGVEGLRKFAKEGRITGDVLVKALLSQLPVIRRELEEFPVQVGFAFNKLRNVFRKALSEFDKQAGISTIVAKAIGKITDIIKSPQFQSALAKFASVLRSIFEFIVRHKEVILNVMNALAARFTNQLIAQALGFNKVIQSIAGNLGFILAFRNNKLNEFFESLRPRAEILREELTKLRQELESINSLSKAAAGSTLAAMLTSLGNVVTGRPSLDEQRAQVQAEIDKREKELRGLKAARPKGETEATTVALPPAGPSEEDIEKAQERFKDFLTGLRQEVELSKLVGVEREKRATVLEAENILMEAGIKLKDLDRKAIQRAVEAIHEEEIAERAFDAALEETNEALEEGVALVEAMATASEEYATELEKINKLLKLGAIGEETAARAREAAKVILDDANEGLQDFKDAVEDVSIVLSTTLEDAIVDIGESMENWRDIIRGVEKDIIRIITRLTVTKPLEDFIQNIDLDDPFGGGTGEESEAVLTAKAAAELAAAGSSAGTAIATGGTTAATALDISVTGLASAATALEAASISLLNAAAALKAAQGTGVGTGGGDIGSIIGSFAGSAGTGSGFGGSEFLPLSAGGSFDFFHKGGVVGQVGMPRKSVSLSAFIGAPRMHSGGVVGVQPTLKSLGLRSNERPIIAEVGERLTPEGNSVRGGSTVVNINLPQGSNAREFRESAAYVARRAADEIDRRAKFR